MDNYIIKAKQSLFDIAIEVYGDVQGVAWLLEDNRSIPGPTGPVEAGQVISIRAEKVNSRAVDYLSNFAPFQTIEEAILPAGIGYWNTENYTVQ